MFCSRSVLSEVSDCYLYPCNLASLLPLSKIKWIAELAFYNKRLYPSLCSLRYQYRTATIILGECWYTWITICKCYFNYLYIIEAAVFNLSWFASNSYLLLWPISLPVAKLFSRFRERVASIKWRGIIIFQMYSKYKWFICLCTVVTYFRSYESHVNDVFLDLHTMIVELDILLNHVLISFL